MASVYHRQIETDVLLRYAQLSTVDRDAVRLAATESFVRFDGFVEQPAVVARALVCVGEIARARFHPEFASGRFRVVADPVVTVDPGTSDDRLRLRFESFSQCCGVHARLDLLEDGLDVREVSAGTTNVDFGEETAASLMATGHHDGLRVQVGPDSLSLQTARGQMVERRVPLPDRWVKGFGEVQVAVSDARPVLRLDAVRAARFLRGLPRGAAARRTHWVVPTGTEVRLSARSSPEAVILAAPVRLRAFEALAGRARSLTAYTSSVGGDRSCVVWVLELPGSRISLTLSPGIERGFSGEGGLLYDLVSSTVKQDAARITDRMPEGTRFTADHAADQTAISLQRARRALIQLGVRGELGYDAVDDIFFRRRLPYPKESLMRDPPRLRDALMLVEAGAVRDVSPEAARVVSRDSVYIVSRSNAGHRCTCPWVARHGAERGPCKHILAYAISLDPPCSDRTGERDVSGDASDSCNR